MGTLRAAAFRDVAGSPSLQRQERTVFSCRVAELETLLRRSNFFEKEQMLGYYT